MRTAQLAVAGELVGSITHDLRQPITALLVNIEVAMELLRRGAPDVPTAVEALHDAGADAQILRDSVQVLQDLVARRQPSRVSVALASVVEDVVRLLRTEAITQGVAMDVGRLPLLPPISADPTMIREALLSLLLDALENCAHDDDVARIRIDATTAEGSRVELTVSHRRRAGQTVEDAWGLAVVRSVVEAHGASMLVDVKPTSHVVVTTAWPILHGDVMSQDGGIQS